MVSELFTIQGSHRPYLVGESSVLVAHVLTIMVFIATGVGLSSCVFGWWMEMVGVGDEVGSRSDLEDRLL